MNARTHQPRLWPASRAFWVIAIALACIRLLLAALTPLIPDEAYYWDWTRFLSAGYYDHPPMVAWIAAPAIALFGDTRFGVHAGPLLCTVAAWFLTVWAGGLYWRHKSSAPLTLIMLNGTALWGLTYYMLTPDAAQGLFWAAALVCGYYALFVKPTTGVWSLLGAIIGLGLLSKYTFALFGISIAAFLLVDRRARQLLRRPPPWAALLACLAVFSPNLLWNAYHDWTAIGFQLGHGLAGKGGVRFDYFGEYWAGQAGLLGLFLFVVVIMASVRLVREGWHDSRLRYLFFMYAIPWGFFGLTSLVKRVEANWPGPAHIAAFIAVAWYIERLRADGARRRLAFSLVSIGVAALLIGAILFHVVAPVLPAPPAIDMTLQARGWDRLGRDVDAAIARSGGHDFPVCANRYQETAMLAFHMPGNPRTWSLNLASRSNHYALLDGRAEAIDDSIYFVGKLRDTALSPHVAQRFAWIERIDTLYLHQAPGRRRPFGLFIGRLTPAAYRDSP
jgi:4-amino-4-deoxy-L-arabinose transferase-like glycosyltransferase